MEEVKKTEEKKEVRFIYKELVKIFIKKIIGVAKSSAFW